MRPTPKPNISWLTDTLATGGDFAYDPVAADAQADALVEMGVTHVFDGRVEANDRDVWAERGITYVHCGVDDTGRSLPQRYFDQAVEFGRAAELAGGKAFLHCHMGINRGPSAALAVLIDRGMDPVAALKLIVAKRPFAGVYYFMGAVEADAVRRAEPLSQKVRDTLRRQWIKLVRNPKHIQHVQRAIEANSAEDFRQRRQLMDSLK